MNTKLQTRVDNNYDGKVEEYDDGGFRKGELPEDFSQPIAAVWTVADRRASPPLPRITFRPLSTAATSSRRFVYGLG